MIQHIALYRFRADATPERIDAFAQELAACTAKTGLAHRHFCGRHLPLPADDAVPDAVYDLGAVWEFASLALVDEFSRHPAMADFVAAWVRPLVVRLALVNVAEPDEPGAGVQRKEHLSVHAS